MNSGKSFFGGIVGTFISSIGTSLQTNQILETISLVLTILGAIITLIIIPVLNWYQKAKKDGKIDTKEIKELSNTLQEGIKDVKEKVEKEKEKK